MLSSLLLLQGCATLDGPPNPDDPLERFNRSMYAFNDTVDQYVMKPVAKGYNAVMPDVVNTGVTNFFNNIDDIVVFFNDLLQLKFAQAVHKSARIVFNTTFGLLGFFDVATSFGLEKHDEDFGQTLGYWGVGSGPYLVLPFLGPSTVRDAPALPVDWYAFDPVFKNRTTRTTLSLLAVKYTDKRADLLKASSIIDETAIDPYAFIRDAYMQRRKYLVNDGKAPDQFNEDDLFNDENLFRDEGLK
jgi:phospholipid-binding lipoprotein MlaA